jgi:hypothetical protein
MKNSIKKEEADSFTQQDNDQPIPPANVIAYNELRSCADLHRMHASGKMEIQPDFQRDVVWKPDEQARFIDSLVKQLPIPSMCFSLDSQSQRWKVIDGLQRMYTITSFLGPAEWRLAEVEDIHPLLRGKRNSQLRHGSEQERRLFESVEDISLPITVIRCSYSDPSHMRYLFTIFNRLNSGGVRLNNQEIRNCVYSGAFNDLLKQFDHTDREWGVVKKRIWGSMDRFRSVEILLRVLAFHRNLEAYDGNLAGFLNDHMIKYARASSEELSAVLGLLQKTTALTGCVLNAIPDRKLPLTLVEGVLVGIAQNVESAPSPLSEQALGWAKECARRLQSRSTFSEGARYALSKAETVKSRLRDAKLAFAAAP